MCRNLKVFKDFLWNFWEKIAVFFLFKNSLNFVTKEFQNFATCEISHPPKKKRLLITYKHDMGAISRIKKTWKKTKMPFWNAGKAQLHHVNWLPYLSLRISSFLPKFFIISKTCQTASTEYFKTNNLNLSIYLFIYLHKWKNSLQREGNRIFQIFKGWE
jgi:hypothetical protein